MTDGQELPIRVLLYRAFRAAEDQVLTQLHESGFDDLTRAQHHLLAGLDDDGGVEVVELAGRAGIAEPTTRALLARLVEAGYVVAEGATAELTERGRQVLATTRTVEQAVEQEWAQTVGQDLYDQVRTGLEILNESVTDQKSVPR